MNRQENTYVNGDDLDSIKLTVKCPRRETTIIFDRKVYSAIAKYHWADRGKSGICNSYGMTLTSFLAQEYGFGHDNWIRLKCGPDYRRSNFMLKTKAAELGIYGPTRSDSKPPVTYHTRTKYKNKYECMVVEVPLLNQFASYRKIGTVKFTTNTFFAQYLPSFVLARTFDHGVEYFVPGKIGMEDAIPYHVAAYKHMCEVTGEQMLHLNSSNFNIADPTDLRVDPSSLEYVSALKSSVRYHYVKDEEYLDDDTNEPTEFVIVELIYRGASACETSHDTAKQYINPGIANSGVERRVFVAIDSDVADHIDELIYDFFEDEFFVRDDLNKAKSDTEFLPVRNLKRLVCDVAQIPHENIYIAPRLNRYYAAAMEDNAGLDTPEGVRSARRRAKFENRIGGGMFVPPKKISKRRIIADKTYFATQIYGGVGIHCMDLRSCSIHLKGLKMGDRQAEFNTKVNSFLINNTFDTRVVTSQVR